MDHTRDPCPWVIFNDFGGAFCMGVCAHSLAPRPSPLMLETPLHSSACLWTRTN